MIISFEVEIACKRNHKCNNFDEIPQGAPFFKIETGLLLIAYHLKHLGYMTTQVISFVVPLHVNVVTNVIMFDAISGGASFFKI